MTCVFCFSVTCGLLVPRVRFSETLCAAHFLSAAVSLLRTIPSLSFFDELACLAGEQYTEMKKLCAYVSARIFVATDAPDTVVVLS